MTRIPATFAAVVLTTAFASNAEAQGPAASSSVEQGARADVLFARGKADMAAGRLSTACASFAESLSLDPAEGTLLALAVCHEKEGELVLAYGEARDVVSRSDREDRRKVGRATMARIEARIGRLHIVSTSASAGCLQTLRVDDRPVAGSDSTRDVPVSAGDHRVACDRSAGKPWTSTVSAPAGVVASVVLPAPEAAPPAVAAAPIVPRAVPTSPAAEPAAPPPPPVTVTSRPPILGWTLGGVGLAALGAGAFFGVRAMAGWEDVRAKCDPAACRDASALEDAAAARLDATVSNVAVVGGAVLLGAGLVLVLTHERRPERAALRVIEGGGRVAF
jgi:hypothetical protein